MPTPADPPSLLHLSLAGAVVFGASALGAFLLHFVRVKNGRQTGRGQLFTDGGSIVTLFVLAALIVSAVAPVREATELLRENLILVVWSLLYSAVMLGSNLVDSIKKISAGPSE